MNVVVLMGRIGRDPECRSLSGGNTVANFSVATESRIRGEKVTQWHRCVAFGKTADVVNEWFRKGSRIGVEGEIQYEKWVDRETQKEREGTKIIVSRVFFVDSRAESEARGGDRQEPREEQPEQSRQSRPSAAVDPFEDDDIPF